MREERLPLALDVLLVALVLRAALLDPPTRHSRSSRPAGPALAGRRREPSARPRSRPAASSDHGGERDAEPDHEVEVEPDQREERTGDHEHVQRVELAQRIGGDLGAAGEELRQERPDHRRRPVQVDPDHRRPVGGLVPGQQVAGEALQHPHREQEHADDPVQLARVLVGAEEEDPRHVEEHQDDEDAGAPLVHAANEPAEREVVGDELDRLVSRFGIRLVVHGEHDARDRLDEEGRQRRRAERVEPVRVPRHLAEEEVLDSADEAGALLEPVERVEGDVLELLAARGRRRYCGTSIG